MKKIKVYHGDDTEASEISLKELANYKYFGYGRNVNPAVMSKRCSTAKYKGNAFMINYKLCFKKYSTIEKCYDKKVPGVLYEMSELNINSMNSYEGYPLSYHIRTGFASQYNPKAHEIININVFWYEKNTVTSTTRPPAEYIIDILEGYEALGLDSDHIYDAIARCEHTINRRERRAIQEVSTALSWSSVDDN